MGVSIGYRIKAIAVFLAIGALFLTAFAGTQPAKVEARANLTAYLTSDPNSWEPSRYNVTGTSPYFITHTLNWSNLRIMGNLGIGDGSVNVLNNSSNQDVNYTTHNIMAGDVSTAPWDSSRLTSAPPLVPSAEAPNTTSQQKNVSTSNNTSSAMLRIPVIQKLTYPDNASFEPKNISAPQANNTSGASAGSAVSNIPLNDPYHTMLLGRPVDDLMYEYPLSISVGAYFRLIGIPMPCGCGTASFSMMCLGYGY